MKHYCVARNWMQPRPAPPIFVNVKETEENDISVKLCMAQWADNALKKINRVKIKDKRNFTIPPPEKFHIILVK